MMPNGSEWHWNLNLHRNQSILNNAVAVNNVNLPVSASLYTSSVLNDHGICVGMRNVNLKGVAQTLSSKMQAIPNCCGNSNIVGERNKQTWTAAYDRMRFSALTDPSMATHTNCPYPLNPPAWSDLDMFSMINMNKMHDTIGYSTPSMSAELNPFHLFGDKSALSTFNVENVQIRPQFASFHAHSGSETLPMNHIPHLNYLHHSPYANLDGLPIKPLVFRSKSPRRVVRSTTPKRRLQTRPIHRNHVVAPKKKWIRNYMQSNCHIYRCFYFVSLFRFVYFLQLWLFFDCLRQFAYIWLENISLVQGVRVAHSILSVFWGNLDIDLLRD